MKVVTVVGARPQFIKASVLSHLLRKRHEEIIVHTGQHYDKNMSEIFFKELNIPNPDYNLGISGGNHGEMTGKMLINIEKVLLKEKPNLVIVYGDTNSTVAAAMAAVKLLIPIVHIEAGNRLGTLNNPEEVNRIVTDHISDLLLCPTYKAYEFIKNEGLEQRAVVVGNIMYDSYLNIASRLNKIVSEYKRLNGDRFVLPEKYYYMTCHRQENTYSDNIIKEVLLAMNELDAVTIYPVHPRNKEQVEKICKKFNLQNIVLIQPVKYSDSIRLLKGATKVITDSGGLQCEAFYAKKQCLTLFDYVCWPETMVDYRNQLVKPCKKDILDKIKINQKINDDYQPFGDGHAAEKILKCIEEKYK